MLQVLQFLKDKKYSRFTRIVFDTAPTGHTLRLLALPDFLDTSVGKILRLRQKIAGITSGVKGIFDKSAAKDSASEKLDAFKAYMAEARDVFRNPKTTQFIIVTIPTAMAAAESVRLARALRKEGVPLHTIVLNQVLNPDVTEVFLKTRRRDQQRALERLYADPQLRSLQVIEAPLFDLEVRGIPALQYFGQQVWK